jgi:hypothetical protein
MENQIQTVAPYKKEAKITLWVCWILILLLELISVPAAAFLGVMSSDSGTAAAHAQSNVLFLIPVSFLVFPVLSQIVYTFRLYILSTVFSVAAFLVPFAAVALFLQTLH